MKPIAIGLGLALAWSVAGTGLAAELEPTANLASGIEHPTARDQLFANMVHATVRVADAVEPDLAISNARYGHQIGAFQVLGDVFMRETDKDQIDHGVVRAKLRVFEFPAERMSVGVGGLARITYDREGEERTDNRPYSLLGVVTSELFPLQDWGGFLVNAYLDNQVLVGAVKGQIIPSIQGVVEYDYYHSSPDKVGERKRSDDKDRRETRDRVQGKAGVEIQGQGDFYFQVLYFERTKDFHVQVGVGF